jgi:hypothetical protein
MQLLYEKGRVFRNCTEISFEKQKVEIEIHRQENRASLKQEENKLTCNEKIKLR